MTIHADDGSLFHVDYNEVVKVVKKLKPGKVLIEAAQDWLTMLLSLQGFLTLLLMS